MVIRRFPRWTWWGWWHSTRAMGRRKPECLCFVDCVERLSLVRSRPEPNSRSRVDALVHGAGPAGSTVNCIFVR